MSEYLLPPDWYERQKELEVQEAQRKDLQDALEQARRNAKKEQVSLDEVYGPELFTFPYTFEEVKGDSSTQVTETFSVRRGVFFDNPHWTELSVLDKDGERVIYFGGFAYQDSKGSYFDNLDSHDAFSLSRGKTVRAYNRMPPRKIPHIASHAIAETVSHERLRWSSSFALTAYGRKMYEHMKATYSHIVHVDPSPGLRNFMGSPSLFVVTPLAA